MQKLKRMGKTYKKFRADVERELEKAGALFDEYDNLPWDDFQADGLWSLIHSAMLNPDYWRAKTWAEHVRHKNFAVEGMLDFIDHALNRALAAYDKKQMIELLAFWVHAWSQHVNDLVAVWKASRQEYEPSVPVWC